jgi:hypothetical protein
MPLTVKINSAKQSGDFYDGVLKQVQHDVFVFENCAQKSPRNSPGAYNISKA